MRTALLVSIFVFFFGCDPECEEPNLKDGSSFCGKLKPFD